MKRNKIRFSHPPPWVAHGRLNFSKEFPTTNRIPTSGYNGFTLIEILVVIVIIGITIGFALIAFGDFGENKRILFAAEQVQNTLRMAQQQAIFENSTLGLQINNKSYQIFKLKNASRWITLPNKSLYKPHYLPSGVQTTLKTNLKPKFQEPAIVINPSGETNQFTLSFGTIQERNMVMLTGKLNGELNLTTAIKK